MTDNPSVFPYPLGGDDLARSDADSGPFMPKSVVVNDEFDWDGDRPLRRTSAAAEKGEEALVDGLPGCRHESGGRRRLHRGALLFFNAHHDALPFTVPAQQFGATCQSILDTSSATGEGGGRVAAGQTLDVPGRTVVLLTRRAGG